MHSIVTTFREAVIKVEVANFGAAIDTLIDQDDSPQSIPGENFMIILCLVLYPVILICWVK